MLIYGIILCYLSGLAILLTISRKYSLAELLGYSFLAGIGLETFFLFVLDIVNIRYSVEVLSALNAAFVALIFSVNYKKFLQLKDEWRTPSFSLQQVNLAAVLIFCIGAYLLYAITVKNLFWPPSEHDTISSFDKLGRIMAVEGKLKISLFDYHLEGAGGVYPPLFHGSFAYVYIFGAETSKIVTTLFFVSLLSSFYGALRNYTDSTVASLLTFVLMITPEMFSHAALSLGNMPTTAYVCAGGLATITWLDKRDDKYFWLGALFIALVVWIRSDTIVFTAAALLIVGLDFLRTKDWKRTIIYGAITAAPFVIWALYLRLKIGTSTGGKFDFGMGYNSERFDLVWGYIKAFLFGGQKGAIDGGQLYGIVFMLFFLVLLINVALIYKNGVSAFINDNRNTLLFLFVSFFAYAFLFYFIDVKVQRAPIASLMESSFKRGMFCFIPIALFYVATSNASTWLFSRIENFRLGK